MNLSVKKKKTQTAHNSRHITSAANHGRGGGNFNPVFIDHFIANKMKVGVLLVSERKHALKQQ